MKSAFNFMKSGFYFMKLDYYFMRSDLFLPSCGSVRGKKLTMQEVTDKKRANTGLKRGKKTKEGVILSLFSMFSHKTTYKRAAIWKIVTTFAH